MLNNICLKAISALARNTVNVSFPLALMQNKLSVIRMSKSIVAYALRKFVFGTTPGKTPHARSAKAWKVSVYLKWQMRIWSNLRDRVLENSFLPVRQYLFYF